MNIATFEGVVENGQIRLGSNVHLPDKAKVYVVVPGVSLGLAGHVFSPRLVHPEQASDFMKEIMEEIPDAGL